MYYFRWPIPERLTLQLACKGGREIRFSLQTHSLATAAELAARHWLRCCDLLHSLDTGLPVKNIASAVQFIKDFPVSKPSPQERHVRPSLELVPIVDRFNTVSSEKLREIVTYLASVDVELFARPPGPMAYNVCRLECTADNPNGSWELYEPLENYCIDFAVVSPELLSSLNGTTDTFLVNEFFSYDPGFCTSEQINGEWKITERLLLYPEKSFPRTLQQLFVRKTLPNQIIAALQKDTLSASIQAPSNPTSPPSKSLSVEIENYHKRFTAPTGTGKDRKLPCTPKTAKEMRSILATFQEVVGNKPVTSITAEDHEAYLEVLGSLPLHYRKKPETRNLSAREAATLAQSTNLESLNATTYNYYLSAIQQFVKYLHNKDRNVQTFILNAKRRKPNSNKKTRTPFEPSHLKLMFESAPALEMYKNAKDPYRLWLPILGLFTGARLNELCQLRTTDIGEIDDTPYIDFNTDDPDKSLKTASSHRQIPIHSKVLELGFLAYVSARRKSPRHSSNSQLFPELTKTDEHNYIRKPSWWFNTRFLPTIGVKIKGLDFHSFRHTVASHLRRQKHLQGWLVSGYIGHDDSPDEKKAEWETTYSARPSVKELLEVAEAITYPINFDPLSEITPQTYEHLTIYKPSAKGAKAK